MMLLNIYVNLINQSVKPSQKLIQLAKEELAVSGNVHSSEMAQTASADSIPPRLRFENTND